MPDLELGCGQHGVACRARAHVEMQLGDAGQVEEHLVRGRVRVGVRVGVRG